MSDVFSPGALVRARDREWVVLPDSRADFLVLRPLGGDADDTTGVFPALEPITSAQFPPPTPDDLGDSASAAMLRQALRIGFRSSAGPFRSLASLAVEPRTYQFVPLMLALRQQTVRLLIADDVGIGKTIEAGMVAAELLAQGDATGLAVLCSPALAEQWQAELRTKFGIDAELVIPGTIARLQRGLGMDESLFSRHPVTVVSTDFIKSVTRRDEFLRTAPDLVIVDEAHTAVSDGSNRTGQRTQRHDLMRHLATDPTRHLVLVTATPHSGQEQGFRNLLELLDPALADVDLETVTGREHLARHFVQRQRGDIRHYIDQDTPFPSDRQTQERPYALTPAYKTLSEKILAYTRESVADTTGGDLHQRVRWWSALALLRALASSPRAAAATLRTRAASAAADTLAEADEIGRASVMDLPDDEALEAADALPGAHPDTDDPTGPATSTRRRLQAFARDAEALEGPTHDAKLKQIAAVVTGLLADGYDPIVFCRFIDTAEYVAEHLTTALKKKARVAAVTGTLPPPERVARIDELTDGGERAVLVATDCLSEGVNLQEKFNAVVHYDLAWNPTRHEQREGRVDRFGQTTDIVRAVTIYGRDNQVDGVVLDVLLRKHQAIRRATGVSVPVPNDSDTVVAAVIEGLLLRGRDHAAEQLTLDLGGIAEPQRAELAVAWESAAEKERTSRTKYAQAGIKPDQVAAEVAAVRAALGQPGDVTRFVRDTLTALNSALADTPDGFTAVTTVLPPGLEQALTPGHAEPLPFHRDPPAPRRHALLARTDPDIATIAAYVLDAALDPNALPPHLARRLARRAGVFRSPAATTRTSVLLLRHRVHLSLPGSAGTKQAVAEDAEVLAYTGPSGTPVWLDPDQVEALLGTPASSIGAGGLATDAITKALAGLPELQPALDQRARDLAEALRDSHARVRTAIGGMTRRGLAVDPILPVDVLGVYVYLPEVRP
jgi:superfamily II DNA or RNA helicase